jgi:hypothetical protein
MRVLFCNKYNFRFSGTEQYIFDLAERLRECGHETALFSMADDRGAPTPFDAHFLPHIDFKNVSGIGNRVRLAAHALAHFDRNTNLHSFGDVFLARMRRNPIPVYESAVLQQI